MIWQLCFSDILKQILRALPFVASSAYETSLFNAAFVIACFGFLRRNRSRWGSRHLHESGTDFGYTIIRMQVHTFHFIRCSKTDQYGNSVSLIFTHSSDSTIRPVLAVKYLYLSVRPNIDGPLFCHFSREPLTKYQIRAMLMKCLKFCGIRTNIKSHSLRIGATTFASMLSIPDEDIKLMGRWSSRGSTHRRANCVDSGLVNYQTGRGVFKKTATGTTPWPVMCTPTPNYLIIHFGGKNLGSANCGLIRKIMKQVELAIFIQRQIMEKSRDRVNRALIYYIIQHGHKAIKHSDFNDKLPGLFYPMVTGVHLSQVGNDIFLSTLQSAL
ncbi:hypothetical protein MAR_006600 [Mya arenaria]|uniref:Uncharacterized protein n=1 Tax=Mya arenaria TaxID=6604 RepID=A0ABY7DCN8_MYAAR|nr:hypothetical protein MAR_006600 [Mya arenaria]